jgi:poly-gamma-glutamate capsule biosynthesis protein CapA/YwtB (metallophosphatase superfamily)
MLGRGVAERLRSDPSDSVVAPEVLEAIGEADLFVLNLECCISDRGQPWPRLGKPFFFRAPPAAVETLHHLGVDCVTLANNHALDFGEEALLDTLTHLQGGGIDWVGAGPDVERARQPVVLKAGGFRLAVIGFSDHPDDFAAADERPGIAHADLQDGVPGWILESIKGTDAEAVLVTPHWGPNMTQRPVRHVRDAAAVLSETRATMVAGHSAHVFQGIEGPILYDLGDFVDDYAVDPTLRNDLGLLFLVDLEESGPVRMEAVPLKLDYCFTRLARGHDAEWIEHRFREACAEFGTDVARRDDRLVVSWR